MKAVMRMRGAAVLTAVVVALVGVGGVLGCRSDQGGAGSVTVPAIHCDAGGCAVCTPCSTCMAKMNAVQKK